MVKKGSQRHEAVNLPAEMQARGNQIQALHLRTFLFPSDLQFQFWKQHRHLRMAMGPLGKGSQWHKAL